MNAPTRPLTVVLAGMVSLAVAMGIGRFAFTPLLPMMLSDGVVDLPTASWLASANYLGYLVGAVLCMLQPWLWARCTRLPLWGHVRLVRSGLVLTGVLALAMAWPYAPAWPLLRFLAGVTSGVVFVYTSVWCLSQLTRLGVPSMGGAIYMGPGAGIVVSGLFASGMVAWGWKASTGWLICGLLAAGLTALVWRSLRGGDRLQPLPARADPPELAGVQAAGAGQSHGLAEVFLLTFTYGIAGFGYIITATFLPVIARAALPGSPWLDLFWPMFGVGVMSGAWIATRIKTVSDFRWMLMAGYLIQAISIACTLWSPSLAGFALGSLLLGLPFTAMTFFAMQEVRRIKPATASSFMGLLTAIYGIGQIVGPPLVTVLIKALNDPGRGFTLSLQIAAASLLIGALLYGVLIKVWPVQPVAKTLAGSHS